MGGGRRGPSLPCTGTFSLASHRSLPPHPLAHTLRVVLRWSIAILGLVVARTAPVQAQVVAGVGDDAIPLPRGTRQFLISGLWNDWDAVYAPTASGGSRRQPLLASLSTSQAGVAVFPQLAATESGLRVLTAQPAFLLSLGALDATGEVRQSVAPLAFSVGISRRLSVRLMVPYVESRDVAQLLLNRAGSTANVGLNPAYQSSSGASARAINGSVLSQIDRARTQLAAEITRCTSPTAAGCDVIRTNAAGAQSLLVRSGTTRATIASVYGDASSGGAPVVPIENGTAQAAVRTTIATLRTDFAAFGVTSIGQGAAPAGATTVYGPGAFSRIVADSAWKLGYGRLGNTRRAGIGDIDLTTSFLLFDHVAADQVRRLLSPSRGVRSMLTAGWRFGTAGADRTDDPFDVPIGEGANALLLRSTTDVVLTPSFWVSATVRSVSPLSDAVAIAQPFRSDLTVFEPIGVNTATRSLGSRVELELAPRLSIGQFFGVSGAYLRRRWGADRYTGVGTPTAPAAATSYETPSRSVNAVAVGVTFSTLASYARGRSRFPAEVLYSHTTSLAGSGGTVPAVSSDRLELRVYTGFPRR